MEKTKRRKDGRETMVNPSANKGQGSASKDLQTMTKLQKNEIPTKQC